MGLVSPDPDGAGPLKHRAERLVYNPWGQVTSRQSGVVADQSDTAWNAFNLAQALILDFDDHGRVARTRLQDGAGVDRAVQNHLYDLLGRPTCSITQMNPAWVYTAPAGCTPYQTSHANGPDRVAQAVYNAAGEVIEIKTNIDGAALETERKLAYTANGKLQYLTDGENNVTAFHYDGFDRLEKTVFPNPTKGSLDTNGSDFEQLWHDANGNVTQRRTRSGHLIGYGYDRLNRLVSKGSSQLADSNYGYDLLGRMLHARFTGSGEGVTNDYDALGRVRSTSSNVGGTARSLTYEHDLAGRRTRLTWWDGVYVDYDRLVTGELWKVRLNGATSGSGVLATFGYDDLGRRSSLTRGNGTVTAYGYDSASRLQSLSHDLGGTAHDLTIGSISYNPAGQITSLTRSNDLYAWTGHGNTSRAYQSNGLNQLSAVAGSATAHDANGNMTSDPSSGRTFAYDIENKLVSSALNGVAANLGYDPLGRLSAYSGSAVSDRRFIHDGPEVTAELDGSGNIVRRYIRGDGADEVLLEFVGSGTSDLLALARRAAAY